VVVVVLLLLQLSCAGREQPFSWPHAHSISPTTRTTTRTAHSVGKQVVDIPSFIVRLDSQKHIDFALDSAYAGGRAGRVKRKRAAAAAKKEEGGEDEEEEEE
jgi:hypothetical protein